MANRISARSKQKTWEQKYRELRKRHRGVRAELAKVQAERDLYLSSLHALTREPFSFSQAELAEMERHPVDPEEVLNELEREARIADGG